MTKTSNVSKKSSSLYMLDNPTNKKSLKKSVKRISLKKSIDGSWEKLNLKEPLFYKNIKDFKTSYKKDLREFLNDLPEGVQYTDFEKRQTPNSNILILKYQYQGIPYPGQKVFFFKKEGDSLGNLSQINNNVPLLKKINTCNSFGKEEAINRLRALSKIPPKNIKHEIKYYPSSGQQAILGHEFHYDTDESYHIVLSACDGSPIRLPRPTRQH